MHNSAGNRFDSADSLPVSDTSEAPLQHFLAMHRIDCRDELGVWKSYA